MAANIYKNHFSRPWSFFVYGEGWFYLPPYNSGTLASAFLPNLSRIKTGTKLKQIRSLAKLSFCATHRTKKANKTTPSFLSLISATPPLPTEKYVKASICHTEGKKTKREGRDERSCCCSVLADGGKGVHGANPTKVFVLFLLAVILFSDSEIYRTEETF
jgi:hypothetical protein